MRLISCYIDNFGLLSDKKVEFKRGLNCFLSDNGTGKTTLSVFIKAMLYGLGDNRGGDNERKKYSPWQGGRYGGSLTFEAEGEIYTAERTFGARVSADVFLLRNETRGGVSNKYSDKLGEELFGIDREGFTRTVFLSEKSIAPDDRINPSVASRLSDIMGADGDIGNYEKAIELIEKRRKDYHKHGGAGEIRRLTEELAACDRRLDELAALKARTDERVGELARINAEIKALEEERAGIEERLVAISAVKERRSYRDGYNDMLRELAGEKKRLAELGDFFGGGPIPTPTEIDEARRARVEADIILRELELEEADGELLRLADFFAPGTSSTEIEEVEATARALVDDEARLGKILAFEDERSREMRELFPARVPTREEIALNIEKAKAKGGALPTVLILLGVSLIAAGVVLGFIMTALFSICAVGLALTIVGAVTKSRAGGGKAEALEFLREICPSHTGDTLGRLYEKKNDLDRYERLEELRNEEHLGLVSRVERGRARVNEFLKRFGAPTDDPIRRVREISQEYNRYRALTVNEERTSSSRLAKIGKEKALSAKAKAFVARFPTTSADPFAEILTKVNDYLYCLQKIDSLEDKCEAYARTYGIGAEEEAYDPAEEMRLRERKDEIDAALVRARRDATIASQEIGDMRRELEAGEEVKIRRADTEYRLAAAKRSLDLLQTTKALIEEAYQNMTVKYTGRTHERFSHYVGLISGEEGEYRLDTNFEITRIERGAARGESAYSRGTKDLYSLAMRLALTDSLYDGELPFLVLDDPFISLDDEKCERAKRVLRSIAGERQILYFTCAESRAIK